jgi:hypothetical protein
MAEKKCTEHGGTFQWLPNGCLKTISSVLPAIRKDERTGNLKKIIFKGTKDQVYFYVKSRSSNYFLKIALSSRFSQN